MHALSALNEMKAGRPPEVSHVSLELIYSSWGVGIQVMAEICRRALDEKK